MSSRVIRWMASVLLVGFVGLMSPATGTAQLAQPAAPAASAGTARVTAADYARAETLLGPAVNGLVIGGNVTPTWLADERFWYRNTTAAGSEYVLVNPAKRTKAPLFDHEKMAAALSKATGTALDAKRLALDGLDVSPDGLRITVNLGARRWACDVVGAQCADSGAATTGRGAATTGRGAAAGGGRGAGGRGGRGGAGAPGAVPVVASPDGKRAVFIRDWNLWLRDVASGQERQLTTDGVKYFGYATDNAGWSSSDRAIVLWSPDSSKVATYQQDEREVGEMYLVNTPVNPVGHPTLRVSKFPLPGDPVMAMLHRVIIDVDTAKVMRLQMPPDYHRATLGDDVSLRDMQWSPDAKQLAFASVGRDHKQAALRVADAATGAVRTIFSETVKTQYEARAGWHMLWGTNEVVWYSERDNWGHLYLYDFGTGALKHQITRGDGPVMQVLRLDEKARTVWFVAQGRDKNEDPYFRHAYRIGLDGKGEVALTPDSGDHAIQLSPSGKLVIDTVSTPDREPSVSLRDGDGKLLLPLEKADISKLLATGWKPPIPIKMTAHDGKTEIYGLLFRPTHFDSTKKYPIVNNVYPGPQTGSTGSRAFSAARGDRQALAELGFIVVTIDGMGTPGRSKAFQDAYYGAMGRDNTIPDQIAGMKELAQKYPWIDLDRAGIWGHSGGGFATTTAMFRFPDFFKAGIAESGNHDQRMNEDDWGERYQGLVVKNADGTDSYDAEANQNFAKNLTGHLLLAHGTMDTNVPPYQTMMVADALIKANKDFDLLMLPNQNHGYGSASAYMMRRRWDYFVKWLVGVEPPKEYQMQGMAPAATPPQGAQPGAATSRPPASQTPAAPAGSPVPAAPPVPIGPPRADILRGEYGPFRANNDLLSYALDIRVDPDKKLITGKNTIRFRMLSDATRIQIDLYANLTIERILLGKTELKYDRELNAVFVNFPDALKKGKDYAIDFYYSGTPNETGRFGGFTFRKDAAGRPWINSSCQGPGASVWWPNKDQQRDEVESMKLSVSVPKGLVDVSNGKAAGKTELPDGYTRYDWEIHYPINPYSVSVNIGAYEHFSDTVNGQTLDFYALPEDLDKAKGQFVQAKGMMEAFEKYVGPYPFPKDGYKLIQVPYSGMEHQTAVTYGNRFANGYLERDWTGVGISSKFDFIIVHESAHEWFGNSVTAADVCDEWIHEGWGTYLEGIYVEHMWGKADAIKYVNGYKSKVRNREAVVTTCGINRTPPQDMYFKGALFINTLRSIVNDDEYWWRMVREFYAKFTYQNITTADVVAFFNTATRKDLTPVFDQYLRHAELPTLELQFDDQAGKVSYRWKADEKAFAMPVKVGRKDAWQVIQPSTEWTAIPLTMRSEDFDVATDLFYINVVRK